MTQNTAPESTVSTWAEMALPALTVLLAMQSVRAFLSYLQYLLGDRMGLQATQMGLIALLVFSTAFITGRLNQWLGLKRLLLVSAGGIGLARLLAQLWPGDPLVDMLLVTIAVGLFTIFLPTGLSLAHWQGYATGASHRFGQSILLGLAADTALHSAFLTVDIIWQPGIGPLTITVALVLAQWLALKTMLATTPNHPAPIDGSFWAMLPWIAIGPFLFLQMLIFQNPARLITLTEYPIPFVIGWIMLGHGLALCVATLWQPGRVGVAGIAVLLLVTLWPVETATAWFFLTTLFVGQIMLALLLVTIIRRLGAYSAWLDYALDPSQQPKEGIHQTSPVSGLAMILLVVLIFAFYVGYSLKLPFSNQGLPLIAGFIIGLAGIGSTYLKGDNPLRRYAMLFSLVSAVLLLILPLLTLITRPTPVAVIANSGPVRVMSYNVHNGFDTMGQLNLEAQAQVIETQQPDIVALQEVSRGWVVNGSVDVVYWLSQRLGLPYAFTATSGPLWGHVVLSRYPIISAENYPLPPRTLPLNRSFAHLQVDTGTVTPLHLINTHLHHKIEDGAIREAQIETMLQYIANEQLEQVIITGDMNATPETPEIQQFYSAGFIDVVITAGPVPGFTFYAVQPSKRLDYVLHSANMTASEVVIPNSTASDHLGIAATVTGN